MYIRLNKIRLRGSHGVLPQESIVGNDFVLDIYLELDIPKAVISDDIADTISYSEVYDIVKYEMSVHSCLLENVCYRIIKRIQQSFSEVKHIVVSIEKLSPPIPSSDIYSASITIDSYEID